MSRDFTRRPGDEAYMRLALEQARLAAVLGEVPVGAVMVRDGQVVAQGYNRRETDQSALAHAEILVIRDACHAVGSWRLTDCTLFVTLEPCSMCAGAIINARVGRVVYGARDARLGCCGSVANLFAMPLDHRPLLTRDVLAEECGALLSEFFAALRERPKG